MSKRAPQPTRTGQLAGAKIRIVDVHNHGLREHIAIVNQGTVAQPLGAWALVALRGKRFYFNQMENVIRQHWDGRQDVALAYDVIEGTPLTD